MNFLSHYYFERKNQNEYIVLGTVLPDLAKNAHKDWNFYPQKNETIFTENEQLHALLIGWKRHLQVDLLFHSSDFFTKQTAILKQLLLPILNDSPVRPSFLAHIGVELVLDHLLVEHGKININSFYDHLNKVDEQLLKGFLIKCGCLEDEIFFRFFNGFKSSRYLLSYQKLDNISYALQRICMRLWPLPFNEITVTLLSEQLEVYKEMLQNDFMLIFEEIERRLG